MNLLDRIEHALADTKFRIDPVVFEECATSLLSETYLNLVPIRGGSDSGRDADLLSPSGDAPTRVAVTSSRSYSGARANLRSSMESLKRDGLLGTSIILVSLAELNQSKRQKLEDFAASQGFELLQVIDRPFFAQRLRVAGDWRSKLLNLPGGPFSLSKTSGSLALDQGADVLVGRDQLIERLISLDSDAVVWGPPGVGKSSVLEKVPGLYFVDGEPAAERLQDDILATRPRMLAVDDASRRTKVLEVLLQIRKHESLTFPIIAVCWPHERDAIKAHLPAASEIEVELLTRREISEIVRNRGLTAHVTLVRILDQARGRPGWAVRLADVLKEKAEWRSVYSGEALRGEVKRYLLRAGLPSESLQLLGIIGLLGGIVDTEIGRLAKALAMSRPQLARAITDIAVGGLLDVTRSHAWDSTSGVNYAVAPDVLAASIVSGVFFSDELPPLSAREIFDRWPSKRLAIATVAIRAALLGAHQASLFAREIFTEVIDAPEVLGSREELLRHYLHLGDREAAEVLDRLTNKWYDPKYLDEASAYELERAARSEATYICEAIRNGFRDAVRYAAQIAAVLVQRDANVSEFLKELVDGVRGFGPGGQVQTSLVVDLWLGVVKATEDRSGEETRFELVQLLRQCMRPRFEATWSSAESWRTIQIASGVLSSPDMTKLEEGVWAKFVQSHPKLSRKELRILVDVIGDWSNVASTGSFGPEVEATAEQVREASTIAKRMATWVLERCDAYPGLRAAIRMHVGRMGMRVLESDPLIEAFFDTREPGEDWRAWGEARHAKIATQVRPLTKDPARLCAFLALAKCELAAIGGWMFADPIRIAFSVIDEEVADHLTWLETARNYGLLPEAGILLDRVLRQANYQPELIHDLLAEPVARRTIVSAALRLDHHSELFQTVYAKITPDDIESLQVASHRGAYSRSAIEALLTHSTPEIRVATAVAILISSEDGEALDDATFRGAWRRAIEELSLPLKFKFLFGKQDFFEKLLQLAPDIYEEALLRLVSMPAELLDWRALNDFEETAYLLPREAKTRVWDLVPHSYWRPTIFRALAGRDSEWIETLLRSGRVDAEFVLDSVNGLGTSPAIEDLARLLVPRGCDPTHIASKVRLGTGSGEEHERIGGYLESMSKLATSAEPAVRAVGEAGLAYFAPLHAEALREARQREIRGEP